MPKISGILKVTYRSHGLVAQQILSDILIFYRFLGVGPIVFGNSAQVVVGYYGPFPGRHIKLLRNHAFSVASFDT
jgi:hypothetical protein